MPTQSSASWLQFFTPFFKASNVPGQICAHSSSTRLVRTVVDVVLLDNVINRFSQLSHASIQACEGVLVIMSLMFCHLSLNTLYIFNKVSNAGVVINTVRINQSTFCTVSRFNHIQYGVIIGIGHAFKTKKIDN